MPIYHIYSFPLPSTIRERLAKILTQHHSEILGSHPSEVVCLFMPAADTKIYRGGVSDEHHVRIVGVIARGRDSAKKQRFLQAVIADIGALQRPSQGADDEPKTQSEQLEWPELTGATVGITLVECEGKDAARLAGVDVEGESDEWIRSIPRS